MLSLRHKEDIHLVEKEIITYDRSIPKKISVLEKERRKLQSGLYRQKMKKKTKKGEVFVEEVLHEKYHYKSLILEFSVHDGEIIFNIQRNQKAQWTFAEI